MADTVRQLTKEGINAFRDYIEASRRGENPGPVPSHLLYGSPYSESLTQQIEIEKEQFYTKYEAAIYFSGVFENLDQDEISYNGGLWSWISLYYIDELLENKIVGKGKLNSHDCYILNVEQGNLDWRKYTYHLLAVPFYLYKRYGEEAKMLLTGPIGSRKQLTFQIVGRQKFSRSHEFIKLVNRLYSDSNGNTRPLVTSSLDNRSKVVPGDLGRLFTVFQQLEFTYDIFNMPCENIIEFLPTEFDEWLDSDG